MKIKIVCAQIFSLVLVLCIGCTPTPEPIIQATTVPQDVELIEIIEEDEVTNELVQTKQFDQRDSTAPLGAEITFSRTSGQMSEQEVVLKASVGDEVGVSAIAKVTIEGGLELHYKRAAESVEGHQETLKVTVPAGYWQEYTIVWREIRRLGSVKYMEGGVEKTAKYDYRIGLELVSSSVKDLVQPKATPTSPTPTPYPTYTPQPTFTPYPTYTPQPIADKPSPTLEPTAQQIEGPTLEMGEWLEQDGIDLVLDFEIETPGTLFLRAKVTNNTGSNLIFGWTADKNFKLYDNTGFVYQLSSSDASANENIGPGKTKLLEFRQNGFTARWKAERVFDAAVTDLYMEVRNLSKLTTATWHMKVK